MGKGELSLWFYASASYLGSHECIVKKDMVAEGLHSETAIYKLSPVPWEIHWGFPMAAVTVYHKLGGLKRQIYYTVLEIKSKNQFHWANFKGVVRVMFLPRAWGRRPFRHPFQLQELHSRHVLILGPSIWKLEVSILIQWSPCVTFWVKFISASLL